MDEKRKPNRRNAGRCTCRVAEGSAAHGAEAGTVRLMEAEDLREWAGVMV